MRKEYVHFYTLCFSNQWDLCRNFLSIYGLSAKDWGKFFSNYIWCQFSSPEELCPGVTAATGQHNNT